MTIATDDWWDRLYAPTPDGETAPTEDADQAAVPAAATVDDPAPDAGEEPEDADTAAPDTPPVRTPWLAPAPDYYPTPTVSTVRPALSPGTRRALYNAGAAAAGWGLGLVPLLDRALDSCGRDASIGAALLLGIGGCLAVAHLWDRQTRHLWPGLAWAARIPLASAITALALYAPASTL